MSCLAPHAPAPPSKEDIHEEEEEEEEQKQLSLQQELANFLSSPDATKMVKMLPRLLSSFPSLALLVSATLSATAPSNVAALAAFKAAVLPSSVPPWSCLASRNFSSTIDPCASLHRSLFLCGVACDSILDGTGLTHIISVVLDNAGYKGSLSPALANLSLLTHFDLSGKAFAAPLPPSLGTLPTLRTLSLASNAFSEAIPPVLVGLHALELLDLSHNALTSSPVPRPCCRPGVPPQPRPQLQPTFRGAPAVASAQPLHVW